MTPSPEGRGGVPYPRLPVFAGAYAILVLAMLPSLVWIVVDKRVWPWDQAWYGQVSVNLFDDLAGSKRVWIQAMGSAFGTKPPMIAWLGQWLVPLGRALGQVDVTLLAYVVATQFLVLLVLYHTLLALTGRRQVASVLGCLVTASAPLFVGMSHQYLVEPLQTLAVAWFVLIAAKARTWGCWLVLAQLMTATAFSLLVKASSPLYCVGPGCWALYEAARGWKAGRRGWEPAGRLATWGWVAAALFLSFATASWYGQNMSGVMGHVAASSSDDGIFGTPAPFLQKLGFWMLALQASFFLPWVGWLVGLASMAGLIRFLALRRSTPQRQFPIVVISMVELTLIVAAFSLQPNQETRYLVPALIYASMIVGWALSQARSRLLTAVLGAGLTLEFVIVNGQSLGLVSSMGSESPWLTSVDADTTQEISLAIAAQETCSPENYNQYDIVGVELPQINANSLSFEAAKLVDARGSIGPCYYTSLGFAEGSQEVAWQRLQDLKIRYFISVDPTQVDIPHDALNQVDEAILQRIASDPTFREVPQASGTGGLLVFQNLNAP